jgi:hypothetical protein
MERRNRRFRRLNSTGTQAVSFQLPLARRFSCSTEAAVDRDNARQSDTTEGRQ